MAFWQCAANSWSSLPGLRKKRGNKLLSVSVAVVWVCLISVAEIFTSGAYSNISEISPWSGVIGFALVSPFMVKILAMSDETFREIYGYVPKYNEPESNARLVFAPVFAVLGALLVTNGQMSSIVTIFLPAQWLIQQDAEKEFYRHHSIWPCPSWPPRFYAWGCGSMMIWRPLSSSPLWLFYAHVQGLESTTAPTLQTIIGFSVLGWRYFY